MLSGSTENVGGTLTHMVNFTAIRKSCNNSFGSGLLYTTTEVPDTNNTSATRAKRVTRLRQHE